MNTLGPLEVLLLVADICFALLSCGLFFRRFRMMPLWVRMIWVVFVVGGNIVVVAELTGGLSWLHQSPDSTSWFVTGSFLFLLVLPQELLLYASRVLLRVIRGLENRVGALEHDA